MKFSFPVTLYCEGAGCEVSVETIAVCVLPQAGASPTMSVKWPRWWRLRRFVPGLLNDRPGQDTAYCPDCGDKLKAAQAEETD